MATNKAFHKRSNVQYKCSTLAFISLFNSHMQHIIITQNIQSLLNFMRMNKDSSITYCLKQLKQILKIGQYEVIKQQLSSIIQKNNKQIIKNCQEDQIQIFLNLLLMKLRNFSISYFQTYFEKNNILYLNKNQQLKQIENIIKVNQKNTIIIAQKNHLSWTISLQQWSQNLIPIQQKQKLKNRISSNQKIKIKQIQNQITTSQRQNKSSQTQILLHNFFRMFDKYKQKIPIIFTKTKLQQLQKYLSSQLPKTVLQILKVQTLVINFRQYSLYFIQNMVRISIISFRILIIIKLLISCSNLPYRTKRLNSYNQLLQKKFTYIQQHIRSFNQNNLHLFQSFYKGKANSKIPKKTQILELYHYLQNNTLSYIFFIEQINIHSRDQIQDIEEKLLQEVDQL